MESETNIIHDKPNSFTSNLEKSLRLKNDNDGNDLTGKCQKWLESCSISDSCSVYSDSDSSVFTDSTTNSAMDSGFVFQNKEVVFANQIINKIEDTNAAIIIKENDAPKYDNVNIYKSRKVHVGDVTYINGPVIISNNNTVYNDKKLSLAYKDLNLEDTFVINRMNWLAQPALGEREYLSGPAKYVIICHTATEEGFTQAANTLLIRLIQTFHIESRKWKDIGYNFLIGSDGLAYEGRGWGVIGAHTRNYNSKSVGLAFIGCFLHHLPPEKSLKKAQNLIEIGIQRGSISEDYILLAHCQCSAIESPGRALFEELQNWKHWDKTIAVPKTTFTEIIEEPTDGDIPPHNLS